MGKGDKSAGRPMYLFPFQLTRFARICVCVCVVCVFVCVVCICECGGVFCVRRVVGVVRLCGLCVWFVCVCGVCVGVVCVVVSVRV